MKQALPEQEQTHNSMLKLCWKWAIPFNIIIFSLWCAQNKKSRIHALHLLPLIVLWCKGRININQARCKWEANIYLKKPLCLGLRLEISAFTRVVGMTHLYDNYPVSLPHSFLSKTWVPRKMLLNKKKSNNNKKAALPEPVINKGNGVQSQ